MRLLPTALFLLLQSVASANYFCIQREFDAAFSDPSDDTVYLFTGDHFYQLSKGESRTKWDGFPVLEEAQSQQITDVFPGLESDYDAAVTDPDNKITYFFKDHRLTTWDWRRGRVGRYNRYPVTRTMFRGIPDSISAVARYRDYFIFFTHDESYYIFSVAEGRLNEEAYTAPLFDDEDVSGAAFHSFFNGVVYTLAEDVYTVVQARHLVRGITNYDDTQMVAINGWSERDIEEDFNFGRLRFCGRDGS